MTQQEQDQSEQWKVREDWVISVYQWEVNRYHHNSTIDKGDRIYNGEKIISSINGAGKTGQLLVKQ